jgi:hypothetical protein
VLIGNLSPKPAEQHAAVEEAMDDLVPDPPELRYARRLSDKLLIAFHHACDQSDIYVAEELLGVLEFMTERASDVRASRDRRFQEGLVAAHERLWQFRRSCPGRGTP